MTIEVNQCVLQAIAMICPSISKSYGCPWMVSHPNSCVTVVCISFIFKKNFKDKPHSLITTPLTSMATPTTTPTLIDFQLLFLHIGSENCVMSAFSAVELDVKEKFEE